MLKPLACALLLTPFAFAQVKLVPECPKGVVAPRATAAPNPPQTPGVERVHVTFLVSPKGEINEPAIIQSGGKQADDAVLRILKQWKFEPAHCKGGTKKVAARLQISFEQK
jgi:TonB family protein